MPQTDTEWLRSAEVCKSLRISTCDLAHLREDGFIRAEKRGNAYYYSAKDVEALRGKKSKKGAGYCLFDGGGL
jgi:DNA-binding transcriptional MerR regulator